MADWYVSSVAWSAIAQFATGSYTVGQIVRPLTAPAFNAQYAFRCTTAGSASAEPTWSSAGGNNQTVTATGGAVFTNVSGQSTYGWSAAAGNLYCISAAVNNRPAAGDRIFVSSDHSETNATSGVTIGFSGVNAFGLIQVVSVNRTGSVPPVAADQLSGATVTATTGNFFIDHPTSVYWQGLNFIYTGAASLFFGQNGPKTGYFRNCTFYLNTASAVKIQANQNTRIIWDNTTLQCGATTQGIQGNSEFQFDWINTPAAIVGATVPAVLFGSGIMTATCRGVDLSAITGTIYGPGNFSPFVKGLLDSCRIAAAVSRFTGTFGSNSSASDEVELVNCYDGTSTNISERHTPAGDLTTNRSTRLVGGAQDDVGLFSHQMVSSTRADMLAMTLDSFWMDVENTLIGTARTATVEIISSGTLNNTDISLTLEYLGTSGSSRTSFASSLPSALTTSAALPTSTATWNSPPATPQAQRLQVTFTPQTAGRLRGIVRLGKPSTTCYVNPQIAVT